MLNKVLKSSENDIYICWCKSWCKKVRNKSYTKLRHNTKWDKTTQNEMQSDLK